MEFVVQSSEGVPEGSLLSIKIGETKRQGPLSQIGQPFRFSTSPAEPLPMKVELLTLAAPPQTLSLNPSLTSLVLDFGGRKKVTLSQRQAPELQRSPADVKEAAESRGLSTDKKAIAQSAASYLEKHDLVRTFQDILHGLLVAKPQDPFAYLEEHVARAKALYMKQVNPAMAAEAASMGAPEPSKSRARGSIQTCSKVESLLKILQRTSRNLPLIMPYLPNDLSDALSSKGFADECVKQFRMLDACGKGKLGPTDLIPVIVQLSTGNHSSISADQVQRFVQIFDANQDGMICMDEFTTLTQFVVVAAHLESDEGKRLLDNVQIEDQRFKDFLDLLESDKDKINDVVPFLPDWLITRLTSDSFMEECQTQFRMLDKDNSGALEPRELFDVVASLTECTFIDDSKLMKFVKVFDVQDNNVITREEFLDFAQFLAVVNFLSTTVEGQQVAQASLDYANKGELDKHIDKLKKDWKTYPQVLRFLPKAVVDDVSSNDFHQKCMDTFKYFDQGKKGSLEPFKIFPLLGKLCAEHPIHMDDARCEEIFSYYDKEKKGLIFEKEVVEFARFVVVISYLICCSEWHDKSVQHSKARIEELLDFLKKHCQQLDDILPYLPRDFQEELMSYEFEQHCLNDFKSLDKNQTGVLEPHLLIPLILQLSEGHHLALTYDHVMEFVGLFDTLRNGVITPAEYINFSRFMMILAFLETEEGQAVAQTSDIASSKKRVEDLLQMLEKDRNTIHKIVPLLPAEVYEDVTSDAFVMGCEGRFKDLDKDKNGTLEPSELFPIIVELSEAHPYAIDFEHCVQFTKIFDIRGDGVIRKDEFVDFARFLCIMSYMQSAEGQRTMSDGLKIMESSREVDALMETLKKDRREMRKVIPYLPDDLRDELLSQQFSAHCHDKFNELDKDGSGSLCNAELYPLILELTDAHHYALDLDQCQKFADVFDDEKTGVISKKEFVNFARFLMVMSYLKTEDGKKTLQVATEDNTRRDVKKPVQPPTDALAIVPTNAGHMALDLEFYQKKADKLAKENDTLRSQMFRMDESIRRMESRMEEQEQRLRHAEIDLRVAGKR